MSFVTPTFILPVKIWTNGSGPPAAPRVTCLGNLAPGRRILNTTLGVAAQTLAQPVVPLLLPKYTDVRGQNSAGGSDYIQIDLISPKQYDVLWVEDSGQGFSNEHRIAVLKQRAPFVLPGPPVPPPGPSSWIPRSPSIMVSAGEKRQRAIVQLVRPSPTWAGSVFPTTPPSYVQSSSGVGSSGTTTTVTYGSPTTAGSFLFAILYRPTGALSDIIRSASGWTRLGGYSVGSTGSMWLFEIPASVSITNAFFTSATPSVWEWAIYEIANGPPSPTIFVNQSAGGTSSSPDSGLSGFSGTPYQVAFGAIASLGALAGSIDPPWGDQTSTGGSPSLSTGFQTLSTSTTIRTQGTLTTPSVWEAIAISLQ